MRFAIEGRRGALLVVAFAVVAHVVLQLSMLFTRSDFSFGKFRGFFPFDQTSYLSIVVNGARGAVNLHEPFTDTGINHYPHAYYVLLGLVARLTGLAPVTTWQMVGLLMQVLLVAGLSTCLIAMTGRRWAGLLAPLPFIVGTFATLTGDDWYTRLPDGHAVLWGAYGVLFPLNAEAASLCLGALCMLALLSIADGQVASRHRMPIAVVACLVIGLLSVFQTYSFLSVVYLVVYVAAIRALIHAGSSVAGVVSIVVSVVLLIALPVVGPSVTRHAGPLAILVGGLLPAAPGIVLLVAWLRSRALVCMAAAVVGALPQIGWTVYGVATRDPFLLYRQVSSADSLSVGFDAGLTAATVPALAVTLVLIAGLVRRRPLWIAAGAGALLVWLLLAGHDRWGRNQEPYRMWIELFMLISVTMLPLFLTAMLDLTRHREPLRAWAIGFCIVVAGLTLVSLNDFRKFWLFGRLQIALIDYQTPQGDAVAALAGPRSPLVPATGLRFFDPCIDPFLVKVRTGLPTAFYNHGMAWPDHHEALHRLLEARSYGNLAVDDAHVAQVSVVLTDSECTSRWPERYARELEEVGRVPYTAPDGTAQRVTLWRLRPG